MRHAEGDDCPCASHRLRAAAAEGAQFARGCLSGRPTGAYAAKLDSTGSDLRAENIQVSGLRDTVWTTEPSLWSRLLQVRALPPEQTKALLGRKRKGETGSGPAIRSECCRSTGGSATWFAIRRMAG
jgi:hypothetical protein